MLCSFLSDLAKTLLTEPLQSMLTSLFKTMIGGLVISIVVCALVLAVLGFGIFVFIFYYGHNIIPFLISLPYKYIYIVNCLLPMFSISGLSSELQI